MSDPHANRVELTVGGLLANNQRYLGYRQQGEGGEEERGSWSAMEVVESDEGHGQQWQPHCQQKPVAN